MQIDIGEAMRYLGAGGGNDALRAQVSAAAARIHEQPRYTYRVMELTWKDGVPFLPQIGMELPGNTAKTMLGNCSKVVLLACTLGLSFDAFISREQAKSMAEAVILDGCGSALVEQGCDCGVLACTELSVFASTHHLPPFYTDAMEVLALRSIAACHKPVRGFLTK